MRVERFFVQRMKTKWGSCNDRAGTIRLNTELAKKPPECLEYIIVHEMVHLLAPTTQRWVHSANGPIYAQVAVRQMLNHCHSDTSLGTTNTSYNDPTILSFRRVANTHPRARAFYTSLGR